EGAGEAAESPPAASCPRPSPAAAITARPATRATVRRRRTCFRRCSARCTRIVRRRSPYGSCSATLAVSSPIVGLEQRILEAIESGREELVELVSRLVAFDTTAREVDDQPRDEADLQAYLGDRLRAAGATVDIWEPLPQDVAGSRQMPPGLTFDGRPQMAASFAGSGGGPSLLLNGHIDVVP